MVVELFSINCLNVKSDVNIFFLLHTVSCTWQGRQTLTSDKFWILLLRHSNPIKKFPSVLPIEWRNSTSRFALLPEKGNHNIELFNSPMNVSFYIYTSIFCIAFRYVKFSTFLIFIDTYIDENKPELEKIYFIFCIYVQHKV